MVRKATISDKPSLCELFDKTISSHLSYISHGEMQMGIAIDEHTLAPDYLQKWSSYITSHLEDSEYSNVLVYEEGEVILGFVLGTKTEDGGDYFGVINDLCVDVSVRKSGIGEKLTDEIIAWFKSEKIESIYLESGLNNHVAHNFFEKKGFKAVSKVFKLK